MLGIQYRYFPCIYLVYGKTQKMYLNARTRMIQLLSVQLGIVKIANR